MAEYSAKDIAALRKATGAGMMDCKQALEESDGDLDDAMDWLRAKGLAKARQASRPRGHRGRGRRHRRRQRRRDRRAQLRDRLRRQGRRVHLAARRHHQARRRERRRRRRRAAVRGLDGRRDPHAARGASSARTSSSAASCASSPTASSTPTSTSRTTAAPSACWSSSAASTRRNDAAREVAHEIALHISFAAPRVRHPGRRARPTCSTRSRRVIEEKSRNEGKPEAKLEGASRVGSTRSTRTSRCSSSRREGPEGHASPSWSRASAATPRSRRFARVKVGED